jgi:integrase
MTRTSMSTSSEVATFSVTARSGRCSPSGRTGPGHKARRALGSAWVNSGLVFTDTDGSPLHPAKVTDRFYELSAAAGLPPIRLHDLRHGAATLTLATGADLKIVQELLGHSSITITADTYAHVLPELARETAEAAARMVPRKRSAKPL